MCIKTTLLAAAVVLGGCFGSASLPSNDDAGYGAAPDLEPLCTSNNDGVIEASELKYPLGLTVRYLANPIGTTVQVAPDGAPGADGVTEWDLSSTAGEVFPLTIEPVDQKWFAASFPDATYATVSDLTSGLLGVFKVTPDALLLLGYASEQPNQTLLVYDAPVATLKLPVTTGQSWVTGAHINGGLLNGQPFASSDTYQISVDARGTAVLPYLKISNTLRIHVQLTQSVPGGIAVTHIQYLFFHECDGELGRMVSNPGEIDPSFTTAAEFRRLAL